MQDDEAYASFWSHLDEFRKTCLKALTIIVAGVLVSFVCSEPLISLLTSSLKPQHGHSALHVEPLKQFRIVNRTNAPLNYTLPQNATLVERTPPNIELIQKNTYRLPAGSSIIISKQESLHKSLIVLGPLEGFLTVMKLSFWVGIVATSPLWLFVFLQFLAPGLQAGEKKLVIPFLFTSFAMISIGIAFAFQVTLPLANQYLMAFNESVGVNLWTLSHYLDYTFFLLLGNALAFELCALGLFAVHLGIVGAEGLIAHRRAAIVISLIVGAVLTPPDVLTQLMLAVPLIGLYELLILYARFRKRLFWKTHMN